MATTSWEKSFYAMTVALGGTVDDAARALGLQNGGEHPIAEALRAPQRATRAHALASAVRDIVIALDEGALR
jgi:hypothetical protein